MTNQTLPAPNHHADHPGFSGPSGLIAALGFLTGRDDSAELAVRLTALRAGDHLVDIGCGPGVAARVAAAHGVTVIGVDPAPVMLRVARRRRAPAVTWRLGTAEHLPVEAGWATVAWSLAAVHHWHDIDLGVLEVRRILAPGGRFAVLEREIASGASGLASHGWTPDQACSFAVFCRTHGFVDVEVETHGTDRGRQLSVVATAPER